MKTTIKTAARATLSKATRIAATTTMAAMLLAPAACTTEADLHAPAATGPVVITPTATLAAGAEAVVSRLSSFGKVVAKTRTTTPVPTTLISGTLPITMSTAANATAATTMPAPATKNYDLSAGNGNQSAATLAPVGTGTDGAVTTADKLIAPNPGSYNFAVATPAKVTAEIAHATANPATTVPLPMNLLVSMSETPIEVAANGTLASALALTPATAALRLVMKTDADVSLSTVLSILSGEEAPLSTAANADAANTASRIVTLEGTTGTEAATTAVAFGMLPAPTDIKVGAPLAIINIMEGTTAKPLALNAPATLTALTAGQMLTYTVNVNKTLATITNISITSFTPGNGTGDNIEMGEGMAIADGTNSAEINKLNGTIPVWMITGGGVNASTEQRADMLDNVKTVLDAVAQADADARIDLLMTEYSGEITLDAFKDCKALASVSAPLATTIGESAFNGCTNLASVDLPGVTGYIGRNAFEGCTNLASVSMPNAEGGIGSRAFRNCTSLVAINMPGVTGAIGGNAFDGCTSLTTVYMPKATSVGQSTFAGCIKLATVNLENVGGTIMQGAFENCSALTEIYLPQAIKILGYAFRGCTKLTTVDLPKANEIHDATFANCPALKTLKLTQNTKFLFINRTAFKYDNEPSTTVVENITLVLHSDAKNTNNTMNVKVEEAAGGKKKVTFGNTGNTSIDDDVSFVFANVEYITP